MKNFVMKTQKTRVLVPFPSPFLYGAERTVIETFDILRPEVEAHFLLSHSALRRNLPILGIVKEKKFSYSFLSDKHDWPVPRKANSLGHLWAMIRDLGKFNVDCLKNSRRKDAIYLQNVQMLYSALLVCIIFRLQRKKVIFHLHELMIPWTPYSAALKPLASLVTDFVHFTQYSRVETLKVNTFLKGRHNLVLAPAVQTRTDEKGDTEAQQFVGQRNIVFIGQVSSHKGVDLLIDAFETISANYEDAVLHIVGGCSEAYQEELHRRIEPLQQRGKIKHWGFRDDAHSFLKIATVFVQPTRPSVYHESFGRSVMEAMALGVPSVCFRSGALQELVVHERTGLICEEESASCLAANICRLLQDAEFRKNCAGNSLQRYRQNYSVEKVKELWLQFFKEK